MNANDTLNEMMMAIVNHDIGTVRNCAEDLDKHLRNGGKGPEMSQMQTDRLLAQFCNLVLNTEVRRQYQYLIGWAYKPELHDEHHSEPYKVLCHACADTFETPRDHGKPYCCPGCHNEQISVVN